MSPRTRLAAAFIIPLLLAGAVYANALHNPFVYDDYRTVVENPSIREPFLLPILLYDRTRPLTNLTFAIDRTIWGYSTPEPLGFHVTNLALHLLNIGLLFRLAVSLARERGGAAASVVGPFAAAALFAVHPMMTESVGYISGRFELLSTTFYLAAILAGRRWLRGDENPWALLTILFWFAALASKETAVMFPFVLFALDWFTCSPGDSPRRRMRVYTPIMATTALLGMLRLVFLIGIESASLPAVRGVYGLIALDVLRRYLALMVNPAGQTIFHSVQAFTEIFSLRVLFAAALPVLLVVVALRLRRIDGRIGAGIAWFLFAMIPSSTLVIMGIGEPMAEHRVYLASCGLFLAAGAGADHLRDWAARYFGPGWKPAAAATLVVAVVVAAFAALTVTRNRVWSDPITLWHESAELAPGHDRPRLLLGEALVDAGRRGEAMDQFRTAIRLRPGSPLPHVKLGQTLAELGRIDEARVEFRKALALDPQDPAARHGMAVVGVMESDGDRR
jgi:hypothetical protein